MASKTQKRSRPTKGVRIFSFGGDFNETFDLDIIKIITIGLRNKQELPVLLAQG
jgi:hypothetical protein